MAWPYETIEAMRAAIARWRMEGLSVGLVPTMGALHEGHLVLVRRAEAENDRVVVSIFVNPLQFGPGEDFDRYPQTLEADLQKLGPDTAVFVPSGERMYPAGATTRVAVGALGGVLEGAVRPGHFEGVATVVAKLFNIVTPDRAYFGQKDAQQVAVIRRMVADLGFGLEVVVCPTVREPDGLAMSSRNAYLDPVQRRAATCLVEALRAAERAQDPIRAMHEVIEAEPLSQLDYAELVDPQTFTSPGPLAVLAVWIGGARLIDNHLLGTSF